MIIKRNKTIVNNSQQKISWYLVDAKKHKLGRLSSKVAYILKNKNSSNYLPYRQGNAKVIIINSENVQVTGKKSIQKTYKRHSGRPGSLKIETFEKLNKRIPNRIIEQSVKGMLPKNALGRKLFRNLEVYPTNIHPHKSKEVIEINIT